MNENLPIVDRFLSYLIDERAFSPYTSRCYGLDLRQFMDYLESELKTHINMKVEQSALDASIAKKSSPTSATALILLCDVDNHEPDDTHSHAEASPSVAEGNQC